jgi:hypothetical protein
MANDKSSTGSNSFENHHHHHHPPIDTDNSDIHIDNENDPDLEIDDVNSMTQLGQITFGHQGGYFGMNEVDEMESDDDRHRDEAAANEEEEEEEEENDEKIGQQEQHQHEQLGDSEITENLIIEEVNTDKFKGAKSVKIIDNFLDKEPTGSYKEEEKEEEGTTKSRSKKSKRDTKKKSKSSKKQSTH